MQTSWGQNEPGVLGQSKAQRSAHRSVVGKGHTGSEGAQGVVCIEEFICARHHIPWVWPGTRHIVGALVGVPYYRERDEAQAGGVVVVRRAASLGSAEGLLHGYETSWPCCPSPLGFAPAG